MGSRARIQLNLPYSVVFKGHSEGVCAPSWGKKIINIKSHHVHIPGGRYDRGFQLSITDGAGEEGVADAICPCLAVPVAGVDEPGAAAEDMAKMEKGAESRPRKPLVNNVIHEKERSAL